jgi:hypothetical protein
MLDGTVGRTQQLAPDQDRVTGRIKLGTESNGGFRQITIRDCLFTRSRGLALETVDGGVIEDVEIRDVVMREVTTAPLFLRLGDRGRGPEGTHARGDAAGSRADNLTAHDILPDYAATIAGLAGHPIQDVTLSHVRLVYARRRPAELGPAAAGRPGPGLSRAQHVRPHPGLRPVGAARRRPDAGQCAASRPWRPTLVRRSSCSRHGVWRWAGWMRWRKRDDPARRPGRPCRPGHHSGLRRVADAAAARSPPARRGLPRRLGPVGSSRRKSRPGPSRPGRRAGHRRARPA